MVTAKLENFLFAIISVTVGVSIMIGFLPSIFNGLAGFNTDNLTPIELVLYGVFGIIIMFVLLKMIMGLAGHHSR